MRAAIKAAAVREASAAAALKATAANGRNAAATAAAAAASAVHKAFEEMESDFWGGR